MPIQRFLGYLILLALIGFGLALLLQNMPAGQPRNSHNITFYLFAHLEFVALPLVAALLLLLFYWRQEAEAETLLPRLQWMTRPGPLALLCLGVTLFTWVGSYLVMSSFPLSMDEFGVLFQAEIFAHGLGAAPLDESWRGLIPWLKPIWIQYHYNPHEWICMYWPMFSLLMAPFQKLGVASLLPPLLAGGTLFLVAAIARQRWQDQPLAIALAVLLLATSPQFLITAMTPYAMTGLLFFNTLWLWLYLKDKTWSWALLPWVGAIVLGMHQPLAHALFVFPFCLRILMRRRWLITFYVGAVYVAACVFWLWWLRAQLYGDSPSAGDPIASSFTLPGVAQIFGRIFNLVYLMSWQHPLTLLLFLLALSKFRKLEAFERDLIWSIALSFIFFFFYVGIGGHGWGARHCHAVLANFALLGAAVVARRELWTHTGALSPRLIVTSTFAVVLLLLPLRMWQAYSFVRPYALADEAISQVDADFVIVDPLHGYYMQDLVRNDPWLQQRPLRLRGDLMDEEARQAFTGLGSTEAVDYADVESTGMFQSALVGGEEETRQRLEFKRLHYRAWYRDAKEAAKSPANAGND